jgi:hypothetical protein
MATVFPMGLNNPTQQDEVTYTVFDSNIGSNLPEHIQPTIDATIYITDQPFETRLFDLMSGSTSEPAYGADEIETYITKHIKSLVKYQPEFFAEHEDPSQRLYDVKSFINSNVTRFYLLGGMIEYNNIIYLVFVNGQKSLSGILVRDVYQFSDQLTDDVNIDNIKLLINQKFIVKILFEIGQEIIKYYDNKCQLKVNGNFVYLAK